MTGSLIPTLFSCLCLHLDPQYILGESTFLKILDPEKKTDTDLDGVVSLTDFRILLQFHFLCSTEHGVNVKMPTLAIWHLKFGIRINTTSEGFNSA